MSALTGTSTMVGLVARRERLRGTAWFVTSGLLLVLVAAGVVATYPTDVARAALAASVDAAAGEVFLIGPVVGSSVGAVASWRTSGVATLVVSLAAVLLVVRSTRATEEDGTGELLGAVPVGRAASAAAALVVAAVGALLAGTVAAIGFVAVGAATGGSALVGAQVVTVGVLAAATAVLAGQVMRTARGANAVALGCVGVFFLLRGAGDVAGGAARSATPFGWIAAVRPFVSDDAAALVPALALAAVLAGTGLWIAAGRDLGSGLLPDLPGPARAGAALRGPLTLALRNARGSVVGWSATALLVGVLIGGVSSTVDGQASLGLGGSAGSGPGLVAVALYLSPLFAAILGIRTTLRLRSDVTSGRAELLLSRPVARARWLLAHTVAGTVAATGVLLAFGVGLAVTRVGSDPWSSALLAVSGVLRSPAAWVFTALATVALTVVPRAAGPLVLVVLGAFQVLELAVEFRLVPPDVLVVSPFALVPQLPDGPVHLASGLLLVLVAAALVAAGVANAGRRDVV
ncbi:MULTISPECIES: ABC transporter permease [unclassified Pseudonocardia]|uniref:ABC transporter permease n=1 Tax=unclassified Pseudonocardia TaxID=2619320 RepID=UPI001CF62DCE|nr:MULTISPECIES: ABC transporter permease [unclassified Pseudonocardia]